MSKIDSRSNYSPMLGASAGESVSGSLGRKLEQLVGPYSVKHHNNERTISAFIYENLGQLTRDDLLLAKAVVLAAPVAGQRRNVLRLLNEALNQKL